MSTDVVIQIASVNVNCRTNNESNIKNNRINDFDDNLPNTNIHPLTYEYLNEHQEEVDIINSIIVDEEIGNTKQQGTGDCWLLSSVNSLKETDFGKKIISDSLEYDNDGAIVHTYFGDYNISYDEIVQAKDEIVEKNGKTAPKYSIGDDDMLVIELGIQKLLLDIKNGVISEEDLEPYNNSQTRKISIDLNDNVLNYRHESEVLFYLAGYITKSAISNSDKVDILNKFNNNPEKSFLTTGFYENVAVQDINGNEVLLNSDHSYCVKNVTSKTVTIVNPWDSSKDINISLDDFCSNCLELVYYGHEINANDKSLDADPIKPSFISQMKSGFNLVKKFLKALFNTFNSAKL